MQYTLIGLLLLAYPVSQVFPIYFAWENGPIEIAGECLLFIGFLLALFFAKHVQNRTLSRFWLVMSSLWLIFLGRELSWGAVFFSPVAIGVHGPVFPHLEALPYGPAVYPALAVIIACDLFIFFKYHLGQFIVQLWQNKKFPIIELAVVIIAILTANCSEQHLFTIPGGRNIVLEEYTEGIVWLGLLIAQSSIFSSNCHDEYEI